MRKISKNLMKNFYENLCEQEKSAATVKKYTRDISAFSDWLDGGTVDKMSVLSYKEYLMAGYAVSSVNSAISSLNAFFNFSKWYDLRVKTVKTQRNIFLPDERELTKEEYLALLDSAYKAGDMRM